MKKEWCIHKQVNKNEHEHSIIIHNIKWFVIKLIKTNFSSGRIRRETSERTRWQFFWQTDFSSSVIFFLNRQKARPIMMMIMAQIYYLTYTHIWMHSCFIVSTKWVWYNSSASTYHHHFLRHQPIISLIFFFRWRKENVLFFYHSGVVTPWRERARNLYQTSCSFFFTNCI